MGTGQYLVAETDESDGSFCLLRPAIAVVTNIDREHLGYYGSFGALENAFLTFMGSVPFGEFLGAFSDADEVIIGDIYPAGEEEIPGVTGECLARALEHPKVSYVGDLSHALPGLVPKLKTGDVVVTLGAGSVGQVGHKLAEMLAQKS